MSPSNSLNKPSVPDLDPKLERLAREVHKLDFPQPRITPEPDSVALAYKDMLPIDRSESIANEPENKALFDGNELDGLSFDGIVAICRGDVSSALDARSSNLRGDVSSLFQDTYTDEE